MERNLSKLNPVVGFFEVFSALSSLMYMCDKLSVFIEHDISSSQKETALDLVLSNYNKITGAHMIISKSSRNNLEYLGIKALKTYLSA